MSHLEGGGAGAAVQAQQNDNGMMALDGHPGQLESFALEAFYTFLKTYSLGDAEEETQARPFYAQQLEQMRIEDSTNLFVDWAHFVDYNSAIADMVAQRFLRLEPSLRQAVLQFVKDIMPEYTQDDNGVVKDFFISVFNLGAVDRLRDLRVEKVGSLCSFAGTVTRTSEVRPELYLGAFRCLECGTVVKGVEQQFKYTEPIICSNHTCGNRKMWSLVREDSVFVDWQRVKVQESVDEVPAGSLPRTLDVIVRNKQVEEAKAGDKSVFTGCLVVVPDVSSMALPSKVMVGAGGRGGGATGADGFTTREFGTREMTYRLMFIANTIQAAEVRSGMVNIRSDEDLSPEDVLASYEPRHAQEVLAMKDDPQVYAKLTHSICPSVWGHDAIKQAVLLMLLGGVHKRTPEGMSLRGDINVAIVGDPACAKSQILKYVSGFLPRAVYTSGKASTAAGLTASVVKEPENNEFAIEAGALMLADNGVCCIDEFDKMDIKDQVAIHEAMEQQTISITKAGIQATLNARASILAAANPVGGRYDKAKPLKYNVALPPALLSRFDLLHVMLDETTEEVDNRIAQHIIRLHRYQGEAFSSVPYSTDQLQRYIKYARAIKPEMTKEAADKLVHAYKELRSEDAMPGSASAYRITVRQLEALVRLSEATARAYCSPSITPAHVEASKRLLRSSILKIEQQDVDLEDDDPLGRPLFDPDFGPGAERLAQDQDMAGQEQQRQEDGLEQGPGQENLPGLANGAAGGGGGAAGAPKPAAPAAPGAGDRPAAEGKKTTKITAAKFTQMKGLLVKRMLEAQEAAYRARDAKQAAAAARAADGTAQEAGADDDADEDDGMRQEDLMRWYMEDQQARGAIKLEEDAEREMELLFKVINHLIKKDQVLAVVYRPDPEAGESNTDYLVRMQSERVLTLHASFNPDE